MNNTCSSCITATAGTELDRVQYSIDHYLYRRQEFTINLYRLSICFITRILYATLLGPRNLDCPIFFTAGSKRELGTLFNSNVAERPLRPAKNCRLDTSVKLPT